MNAVASQIFLALCVYLQVAFQKFVARYNTGIKVVLSVVQLSLCRRQPAAELLSDRQNGQPDLQMPLRLKAA